MPARDDHLSQARHNAKFYGTIDKVRFRDWAVTVLFYTGLHYIDAFLSQMASIHPSKHKERDNLVATVSELKPIYVDYAALKTGSSNGRYMPGTAFSDSDMERLENRHLARIREQISRYLTL